MGLPKKRTVDVDAAIRALRETFTRRIQLDDLEGVVVAAARHADPPVTWREIARALDLTETHVVTLYGDKVRHTPTLTSVPEGWEVLQSGRLDDYQALQLLRDLAAARRRAERDVTAGVVAAKKAGATWQRIGDAIALSYGKVVDWYGPAVRGEKVRLPKGRPLMITRERRERYFATIGEDSDG